MVSRCFNPPLGSWPKHSVGNAQRPCKAQQPSLHDSVCWTTLWTWNIHESSRNHENSWIIHDFHRNIFMIFYEWIFSLFTLSSFSSHVDPTHTEWDVAPASLTGSRKSPGNAGVGGISSSRGRPEIQMAGAARASTKKRRSSESAFRSAEILHRDDISKTMCVRMTLE